ncbi:hypothetical protein FACS1894110_05940 [Spirochaetia bacterium]|nr:hypothetical protein FACS1894110_05940 [Spirochaetia bacterium]
MKKALVIFVLCVGFSIMTFAQDMSDFETTVENGTVTITGYTGTVKDVRIPAEIDGLPVTAIGLGTFYGNELTSVTIPNGVISIGSMAFYGNRLTSIIIPNSVISIGSMAFYRNRLTSVTIPNGVTSIEDKSFAENPLTSLTIGNSVTTIGDSAFYDNRLTRVTIPNSVTSIGEWAFTSSLGDSLMDRTSIDRIVIGSNVDIDKYCGFLSDFAEYYNKNNKRAGTYIRNSGQWSYRP